MAGPQRGCRVAHEQDTTGQGASLTPGTVVRSRPAITLRPAPAALPRPVPAAPLEHPTCGGHLHETSSEVHSRSPITPGEPGAHPEPESKASRRSSPRLPPPDGTRAASASSPGSAPRSYPRRTPGRRRAIAHWPGYCAPGISRTSNSASHLNSCTLTPHPPIRRFQDNPRVRPSRGDRLAQLRRAVSDPGRAQPAPVLGHPHQHTLRRRCRSIPTT